MGKDITSRIWRGALTDQPSSSALAWVTAEAGWREEGDRVAALVLVGASGWHQRWEIAPGQEETIAAELSSVGTEHVGRLQLFDLEADCEVILVIAWEHVATAVIIPTPSIRHRPPGQYT